MFLSDKDIKAAIERGEIRIDDFDEKRLNQVSYDLILGNKFFANDPHMTPYIDPVNKVFPPMKEIVVPDGEAFVLHPGFSILGYSADFFGSDKYVIELNGKSSLARIGLLVHASAPLVNPGHYLNIAMELFNLNNLPILLRPKMPIAQLTFTMISSETDTTYKDVGRYVENNFRGWVPERSTAAEVKGEREKVKGETNNQNTMQKQSPAKAAGKTHLPQPKNDKIKMPKENKQQFKKGTRGH